jgi:hypothetical protein
LGSIPSGTTGTVNRIRSWTTSGLRAVAYAAAVLAWSLVGFTILVTGVSVVASTLALIVGIFVWLGFVYVLRWTTWVDRRLAGWQRGRPVGAVYRRADTAGIVPTLKTVSSDRQTWKELSWLGLNSIVGFTLGLAVITAAGIVATYLSMPIWYWAVSSPASEHGLTNLGLYTVDTLGEALITMGIGLALTPLVLLLARWSACTHAGLAARYLGSAPQATV